MPGLHQILDASSLTSVFLLLNILSSQSLAINCIVFIIIRLFCNVFPLEVSFGVLVLFSNSVCAFVIFFKVGNNTRTVLVILPAVSKLVTYKHTHQMAEVEEREREIGWDFNLAQPNLTFFNKLN